MALSISKIEKEVTDAGFKLVDASSYVNLSSIITIACDKGHEFKTSLADLRKAVYCPVCSRSIVSLEKYPPTKGGYRIVALDQATNLIGVSVFDDGQLVYATRRIFKGELGEKYRDIFAFLIQEVIAVWQPDELIFEDIQYQQNPLTHKVLGGLWGICILAAELRGIPHSELLNVVWQSKFNIKGRDRIAQKKASIAKVKELFDISTNDDISDAILLGYYQVLKQESKWRKSLF